MRTSVSSARPTSLSGGRGIVLASAFVFGGVAACSAGATRSLAGESGGDAATGGVSDSGSGASSGSAGGGTGSASGDGAAPGSGSAGSAAPSSGSSGAGQSDGDGSLLTETGGSGGALDGTIASTQVDGASTGDAGGGPGDSSAAGDALKGCAGLFCEDFESGRIDPNVWNVRTSGGQSVLVQSAMAAHGKYAAQFHALPNVLSYDLLITRNAPMGLRGHHFGRAYFYVTPKPPAQHTTMLFAASAGFPTFKRLEVSSIGTGLQLTSVNQTGINGNSAALPGTTEVYLGGGTLPVAQWDCLEWELNDTPDQIRAFLNGNLDLAYTNIALGGLTSGQVGGFVDFGFGYYAWHPATYVFDMFYDDIVLDTNRVGCLP